MKHKDKIILEDEDGLEVELPTKMEVCGRCEGKGVHDHPAFSNGISQEDFDEDPDFREDYFKGRYDVSCERCGGLRVVPVPDEERMTDSQKKLWEQELEHRAELAHEAYLRSRGIEY